MTKGKVYAVKEIMWQIKQTVLNFLCESSFLYNIDVNLFQNKLILLILFLSSYPRRAELFVTYEC